MCDNVVYWYYVSWWLRTVLCYSRKLGVCSRKWFFKNCLSNNWDFKSESEMIGLKVTKGDWGWPADGNYISEITWTSWFHRGNETTDLDLDAEISEAQAWLHRIFASLFSLWIDLPPWRCWLQGVIYSPYYSATSQDRKIASYSNLATWQFLFFFSEGLL